MLCELDSLLHAVKLIWLPILATTLKIMPAASEYLCFWHPKLVGRWSPLSCDTPIRRNVDEVLKARLLFLAAVVQPWEELLPSLSGKSPASLLGRCRQ